MVWRPPPRCALRWATFAWLANRSSRSVGKRERRLEAPPGFEPGVEVLQFPQRHKKVRQLALFLGILPLRVVPSRVETGRNGPRELRRKLRAEHRWFTQLHRARYGRSRRLDLPPTRRTK